MGEKALLTDEIMPKLDISAFPEIINDYIEAFPDIEQFITRIDLKYFQFKKTNNSLANKFKAFSGVRTRGMQIRRVIPSPTLSFQVPDPWFVKGVKGRKKDKSGRSN
ncbi:MAG: hypothetical protein HY879_08570 [Deltaproteobacteria bacterium]|nr:hypothetical protein [Deltaproteobacteria bacterium]